MALLNNPMGALANVNRLAFTGDSTSASKRIGDACYPDGERFASLPYSVRLITPDGRTCTYSTFCDGQCSNGKIVATGCDQGTLSDCTNSSTSAINDRLSPL